MSVSYHANRFVAWIGTQPPAGLHILRSLYAPDGISLRCANAAQGAILVAAQREHKQVPGVADRFSVIAGDPDNPGAEQGGEVWGNACSVDADPGAGTLCVRSSLTGFPPVYYCNYERGVLVGTDLPSMVSALGRVPSSDPLGIADTVRWGYPVAGRTTLLGVRLLQPASILLIHSDGSCSTTNPSWLAGDEPRGKAQLIAASIAALEGAVSRMRMDSAFLSLSGGLDSRVIAVAASRLERYPVCVTVAGGRESEDALNARAACAVLGLEHETIALDDTFRSRLPTLVWRTAALTGGVDCLAQCADQFMYEMLAGRFSSRVSGNLGNQVGRGGVESIPSQPRVSMLDHSLRNAATYTRRAPWYFTPAHDHWEHVRTRMNESLWCSLANFSVGAASLQQLMPYADSSVMRAAMPLLLATYRRPTTVVQLRVRDILHRLIGPRMANSFQRQYLRDAGFAADAVPINLGWRAAGGAPTAATLLAKAENLLAYFTLQRASYVLSHLPRARAWMTERAAAAPLVDCDLVVRTSLREMFLDTLHSAACRKLDGIDAAAVTAAIRAHSGGTRDHARELIPVFQLTLGQQALQAVLSQATVHSKVQRVATGEPASTGHDVLIDSDSRQRSALPA